MSHQGSQKRAKKVWCIIWLTPNKNIVWRGPKGDEGEGGSKDNLICKKWKRQK